MNESDYKKIRQFRYRLNMEAGIRAGNIGVAMGLAGFAAVLLYGRMKYEKLMLKESIVVAVALFVLVLLTAYFLRFRPKKKEVLKRIDALGLEERVITMEELKNEDTVIAKKQRQDATEHLAMLETSSLKPRLYIKPLLWCAGFAIMSVVLLLLPFPEKKVDAQEQQNAAELQILDELITALREVVDKSELSQEHRQDLNEIVDALEMSFTPEDSTLTRTAKIATASKRLDMLASAEKAEVTLLKQQEEEYESAEEEQKRLEATIKEMKDLMGTSITVLNKVEGTFWTPGGPSSGTSYEVEPLPTEDEPMEGEESPDSEEGEPGEGEVPPEGMEPGDGGELPEGMEGEMNGNGGQTIFDPEQGEISYGSVYEEYYQEILKALTEQEFSGDIREMIEDYANSLE